MKRPALDRFTICLEKGLLARLDEISSERGYPSRSRAMSDFIRRAIAKKDWQGGRECAATVSLVYDHSDARPGRGLERLLGAHREKVLSCHSHILRNKKTLCTVTVTGRPAELQGLADSLRALKGVTHGSFSIVSPL